HGEVVAWNVEEYGLDILLSQCLVEHAFREQHDARVMGATPLEFDSECQDELFYAAEQVAGRTDCNVHRQFGIRGCGPLGPPSLPKSQRETANSRIQTRAVTSASGRNAWKSGRRTMARLTAVPTARAPAGV